MFMCQECHAPLQGDLDASLIEVIAIDYEKHGGPELGGAPLQGAAAFQWLRRSLGEVKHPLCVLCARAALKAQQERTEQAELANNEAHKASLRLARVVEEATLVGGSHALAVAPANNNDDSNADDDDDGQPSDGQPTEESLQLRLAAVRARRRQLAKKRARLVERQRQVAEHAARYWQLSNALLAQAQAVAAARAQIRRTANRHGARARVLADTVVLGDACHIWHQGHFGTICGLRLGRLPPAIPVDWTEINAAWGQTVLLLSRLAEALRAPPFDRGRLRPMFRGSFSKIWIDGAAHELFGSSDVSLSRLFWYRRFDNGMVAFLQCVKELADYCTRLSKKNIKKAAAESTTRSASGPPSGGSNDGHDHRPAIAAGEKKFATSGGAPPPRRRPPRRLARR